MSLRDLCAGSYRIAAEKYRAVVIIELGDTNERTVYIPYEVRGALGLDVPVQDRRRSISAGTYIRARLSKKTTNSGAAAGEKGTNDSDYMDIH